MIAKINEACMRLACGLHVTCMRLAVRFVCIMLATMAVFRVAPTVALTLCLAAAPAQAQFWGNNWGNSWGGGWGSPYRQAPRPSQVPGLVWVWPVQLGGEPHSVPGGG